MTTKSIMQVKSATEFNMEIEGNSLTLTIKIAKLPNALLHRIKEHAPSLDTVMIEAMMKAVGAVAIVASDANNHHKDEPDDETISAVH